MKRSRAGIRRPVLAIAVAALVVAVVGGTALAGHQTGNVKSYTGCLVSGDGVVIKIAEGNTPRSACTGGQVQAHFSGGDISKISVGSGLTLPNGGDNGEVRINLDPAFSLPQGCSSGQVAKWNGSAWACAADNDTTYSAGTGLDLTGTTFSVEPDAFAKTDQACTSGQFANGVNSGGNLTCAAPPAPTSAGIAVWEKKGGSNISLPDGEGVDLISMPLAAGTYLVTAVATLADLTGTGNGDEEVSASCWLRNAANAILPVQGSGVDIGEAVDDQNGPSAAAVVHGALTLAGPDTVKFVCLSSDSDGDEALGSTMSAIKIGSLTTP